MTGLPESRLLWGKQQIGREGDTTLRDQTCRASARTRLTRPVAAEVLLELIAANSGIGFMIEYYSGVFDATGTYAAILVLVIMSVGLTEILTLIEARMSHGHRH
jgi:ABC-type nitrate/sulfonate/bicarbonate transport system permease component